MLIYSFQKEDAALVFHWNNSSDSTENEPPITNLTTVDGGYTDFGGWSACSRICGPGTQIRRRTCTNPPPSNGGAPCDGPDSEKRECNLRECPGLNFTNQNGCVWLLPGQRVEGRRPEMRWPGNKQLIERLRVMTREPYNLRPRTTFYLSWFSRYCGFMNCHVTPMRILIGSESSRTIN